MATKQTGVKVKLVGKDGNAFAIMAEVQRSMKQANISPEIIKQYLQEAISGDYNHLLQVTIQYVEVE